MKPLCSKFFYCSALLQYVPPWRLLSLGIISSLLSLAPSAICGASLSLTVDLFVKLYNQSYTYMYGDPVTTESMAVLWGVTNSIVPAMNIPGCLLAIPLANCLGRRYSLMIVPNCIIVIGCAISITFRYVPLFPLLIAGRAVCGVAIGMSLTLLPMYMIELSPVRFRGFMASLHGVCYISMNILAAQLSSSTILGNEHYWPLLVSLQGIPALLQLIFFPLFPESPQYLYINDRKVTKAKQVLDELLKSDQLVDSTMDHIRREGILNSSDTSTWREVLREPHIRLASSVSIVAGLSQSLCGSVGFYCFTVLTLEHMGFSPELAQTVSLVYFWSALPGIILSPFLIEFVGRRPMLLYVSSVSVLLCLFVFVVYMIIFYVRTTFILARWFCATGIILHQVIYPLGPGSVPWYVGAETTPERARSFVSALNLISLALSATIVEVLYPILLTCIGPWVLLVLVVLPSIPCISYLHFMMPETKRQSMIAIIRDLNLRWSRFKRTLGLKPDRAHDLSVLLAQTSIDTYGTIPSSTRT